MAISDFQQNTLNEVQAIGGLIKLTISGLDNNAANYNYSFSHAAAPP